MATADLKQTLTQLEKALSQWDDIQEDMDADPINQLKSKKVSDTHPAKKQAKDLLNKLKEQINELS